MCFLQRSLAITYAKIVCVFTAILVAVSASAATPPSDALDKPDSEAVVQILGCLTNGQDAVLHSDRVECTEFGGGTKYLNNEGPNMQIKMQAEPVCNSSKGDVKDLRKLLHDAIKRIAAQKDRPVSSSGIRIFGAIFCDRVDLVGLDLPYSLVMDGSVFHKGILARGFRTRGDFSFDKSLVLGTLSLVRSLVQGTILASDTYIEDLQILDSEIHGSALFRRSLLAKPAVFDTVSLSGELSLRESAFSYLLLQFSKVGGVLDLEKSQARCAHAIRKNEISDLNAVDAGFGNSRQDDKSTTLFDWRVDPRMADSVKLFISSPSLSNSVDKSECPHSTIAEPGTFLLSDNHIRWSLCFRSFHWLSNGERTSSVTLNDLSVGAAALIDLTPGSNDGTPTGGKERTFRVTGINADSLYFNFGATAQIKEMYVSGLTFTQVYSGETDCAYVPPVELSHDNSSSLRTGRRNSQFHSPGVDEVMSWLDRNCLETTQPVAAFVDAAQKSGNDNDAKNLRIARATKELKLKEQRIFGGGGTSNCPYGRPGITGHTSMGDRLSGFFRDATDFFALAFGMLLWFVADHGYRPEKVGWFVVATLVASGAYFWLWVRVVGFKPTKHNRIRPIGLLFLFDRLLPIYKIREENYDIESFFKRTKKPGWRHYIIAFVFKRPIKPTWCKNIIGFVFKRGESTGWRQNIIPRPGDATIMSMNYFWLKIPVVKADEEDVRRAERCLDVVKVIGLVLAIFLVAAVNALVRT